MPPLLQQILQTLQQVPQTPPSLPGLSPALVVAVWVFGIIFGGGGLAAYFALKGKRLEVEGSTEQKKEEQQSANFKLNVEMLNGYIAQLKSDLQEEKNEKKELQNQIIGQRAASVEREADLMHVIEQKDEVIASIMFLAESATMARADPALIASAEETIQRHRKAIEDFKGFGDGED